MTAVPGDSQPLVDLLGKGASQRIFRRFIESSYITFDPNIKQQHYITIQAVLKPKFPKNMSFSFLPMCCLCKEKVVTLLVYPKEVQINKQASDMPFFLLRCFIYIFTLIYFLKIDAMKHELEDLCSKLYLSGNNPYCMGRHLYHKRGIL